MYYCTAHPQGLRCSYPGSRTKAACCTITKAPPKPAFCTANLCQTIKGFCPNDSDDESANNFTLLDLLPTAQKPERDALQKRGGQKTYNTNLGAGVSMRIIGAIYPSIGELFDSQFAAHVLRRFFRLIPGYCNGPSVSTGDVGAGESPDDIGGLQSEHPIDVSITLCVRRRVSHQCSATNHEAICDRKHQSNPTFWATSRLACYPALFLEESMACYKRGASSTTAAESY